jgi:hypothetical protein
MAFEFFCLVAFAVVSASPARADGAKAGISVSDAGDLLLTPVGGYLLDSVCISVCI